MCRFSPLPTKLPQTSPDLTDEPIYARKRDESYEGSRTDYFGLVINVDYVQRRKESDWESALDNPPDFHLITGATPTRRGELTPISLSADGEML